MSFSNTFFLHVSVRFYCLNLVLPVKIVQPPCLAASGEIARSDVIMSGPHRVKNVTMSVNRRYEVNIFTFFFILSTLS